MDSGMTGTYDIGLVALSFVIAVVASYTALDLAERVQSALKWRRLFWLLGGAVAMGTGIWSMHFIAMLAFQLPESVNYSVWITLLSLVCGISASGIALWLLSRSVSSPPLLVGGGVCMGIAIAWMHYTGMAAMQLQARIDYDWGLVGLSVAIAISASFAALWLAFRLQNEYLKGQRWQKLGSALVMGVAISGMHYTGMWATHFIPQQKLPAAQSPMFNQFWLAVTIAIATLFILSLALLTSLFDQRLTAQLVREQALQESEKRFRMLIREMQVGVLLLNAAGEILICNQAALDLLNLKTESELPRAFGSPNWLFLHEDSTPFQPTELPVQRAITLRQPIHNVVIEIERLGSQNRRWLLVNADPQIAEDGSVERVVCTFSDITNQKQAEATLRRSAEMDNLLSRISRMLIDEKLDTAINFTLQAVGEFLRSDHTYLFDYYDNQNFLRMTHEWCNEGIEPVIHKFQKLPVETHGWVHSQLKSGKPVQISTDLLPIAIEKADWELKSIQSRLAVPMLYSGKVVGFIGLDAIHSSSVWSQEEMNWLRLISEFIAISQARQEAQAALQRSNTRYQNLAENVPGMIYQFVLNPDGSMAFPYVSPGCREIFGLEPETLMRNATLLWKIAHPDDVEALHQSITDSARTLQAWDYVWRCFVSCQLRYLRGNSRPELQPDGSIIWDGLVTDITARQQAEEALRESAERERAIAKVIQQMRQSLDLESIFSATTQELRRAIKCDRVLVYRFNPNWSGEFVCESVAAGWKVLVQEQIKQPELTQVAVIKAGCAVKTLGSEDNSIQDTYLQETQGGIYRQGKSYTCVPDIYEAGFDPCYLDLLERFQVRAYIIVPIFCGNQLWGLLATYQNSSPRLWEVAEINMVVQIGTQLGTAIQQAELLAQTQRQAEELKKAKEAADAANRAKSTFLTNMSHELRTPLNAILGFTQLMNRDQSLTSEHQQYLDIVTRSGEYLLKLINDVLEMSKIETGRTTLNESSFDLYRLLSTVEEILQLKARAKGLELTFECAPEVSQYVKTDESKLRQVLINLVGNAIKFTKQGHITVRVLSITSHWLFAENNPKMAKGNRLQMKIHFEVEDTGPGIAPDELKKLFEPFEQTETGLKTNEGTGLGLPISQNFVQLMGGKIAVSSQPGVGSVFRFDIQVTPVHGLVEKTSQPTGRKIIGLAPGQPTYRILVAEDNPTDRLLLVKLLSSLEFEVREAQNGQEALAVWEHWEPHLIWMDMRMPVVDGYEVTQRIKASLKGQATVVIALTASAFEEQRQTSLLAGCDDFLRKPFERDELLAKLSQHLGVQYVHEDEKEKERVKKKEYLPSSPFKLQSSITNMPPMWVEQLCSAALQCNDHLIFELIEQIPEENSSLAVALTNLAENFQFDQISILMTQYRFQGST